MSELTGAVKSEGPEWCDLKAVKAQINNGKNLIDALKAEYPDRVMSENEIGYVAMTLMIFEGVNEAALGMNAPYEVPTGFSEPEELNKFSNLELAQFLMNRLSTESAS